MGKKQYKVKIENGLIKPLENIDFGDIKEAVVIFLDIVDKHEIMSPSEENINEKLKAIDSVAGMFSDLTNDQISVFDEAIKRRDLF